MFHPSKESECIPREADTTKLLLGSVGAAIAVTVSVWPSRVAHKTTLMFEEVDSISGCERGQGQGFACLQPVALDTTVGARAAVAAHKAGTFHATRVQTVTADTLLGPEDLLRLLD